ncbi:hypothetical protein BKH46_04000 [Helicobacter sp. 12S02634-8]|nr:hypothetical protein BKH46_04000 [Helicobacter sp. 12S02634-8]
MIYLGDMRESNGLKKYINIILPFIKNRKISIKLNILNTIIITTLKPIKYLSTIDTKNTQPSFHILSYPPHIKHYHDFAYTLEGTHNQ